MFLGLSLLIGLLRIRVCGLFSSVEVMLSCCFILRENLFVCLWVMDLILVRLIILLMWDVGMLWVVVIVWRWLWVECLVCIVFVFSSMLILVSGVCSLWYLWLVMVV